MNRLQTPLAALLDGLRDADVRRLAWSIGSPALFDASRPEWQGRLRDDDWSQRELVRCREWLLALDHDPAPLHEALGDPMLATPLGHTFEKFVVLFWQAARPDVRASTRGPIVREGGRTRGEFDIVMLRHDGVIETLEVTVKFYLSLRPDLGIDGCIGPRAFDRMSDKYAKMTTRQTDLGHTDAGRAAIARWLQQSCGETVDPDALVVDNHALARGYVSPGSGRRDPGRTFCRPQSRPLADRRPAVAGCRPRSMADAQRPEMAGDYRGDAQESGWPSTRHAAMLAQMACGHADAPAAREVAPPFCGCGPRPDCSASPSSDAAPSHCGSAGGSLRTVGVCLVHLLCRSCAARGGT